MRRGAKSLSADQDRVGRGLDALHQNVIGFRSEVKDVIVAVSAENFAIDGRDHVDVAIRPIGWGGRKVEVGVDVGGHGGVGVLGCWGVGVLGC